MNKILLNKSHGFSIVEMMVSVLIGSILTLGLIQIFFSNKSNFNAVAGESRIQENIRMSKLTITREIRMAGFQGCSNSNKITPSILVLNPNNNITLAVDSFIVGNESTGMGTWSPALPVTINTLVKQGTDVITIRKASTDTATLANNMTNISNDIVLSANTLDPKPNDTLLITDCEATDIFVASNNTTSTLVKHTTTENISSSLSKAYQTDARIMLFESTSYYVKDTGRVNQSGNTIFALFSMDLNSVETELIEGVEELLIDYGIDTTNDGSANSYVKASVVEGNNDWGRVISVKLNILLNSTEAVELKPQTYTFNNVTTTPTDNIKRQSFNIFINLRNRFI